MKRVINGIILEHRKILLVDKRGTWIVPGGKPENGESDLVCLAREFREELSGTEIDQPSAFFYGDFYAQSPYSGSQIHVRAWHLRTPLVINNPSSEIRAKRFVTPSEAYETNISHATQQIMRRLEEDLYL